MATLATGSGGAKLIGIAAIPVLTRLYSPEDFGVLAVFTALIAIAAPVFTLRYALSIPLPRHDGVAFNLLALSCGLIIIFMAIATFLLWMIREQLLAVFSMQHLEPWWWLIALGVAGAATYEMMTLWATRKRNYAAIARTNIWQSACGALTKILLGLAGLQPAGLLVGQVVTSGGGVGILFRNFLNDFRRNARFFRWSHMRKAAWHYRAFPYFRVPSQFLMVFSLQAPLLFVAMMYDSATTGHLGMALTALALPLQIFGRTLSNAFYAEAAELGKRQPEAIRVMALSVLRRLAFLSFLPALALLVFGPSIFELALGREWREAGTFASILSVCMIFQFLQTPVAQIFYLFDGQRALLLLTMQRVVLVVSCFSVAYILALDPPVTVLIYSLVISAHYALSTFYAIRFIPISELENQK